MMTYRLETRPNIKGYAVVLSDGTLIGYVDPTDDPDIWIALSAYDDEFYEEGDSEDDAACWVWDAYQGGGDD